MYFGPLAIIAALIAAAVLNVGGARLVFVGLAAIVLFVLLLGLSDDLHRRKHNHGVGTADRDFPQPFD